MTGWSRTLTQWETRDSGKEPWFKKLFQKNRDFASAQERREKRNAYRLNLVEIGPTAMTATIENGTVSRAVLNDLSAGGFSCIRPKLNDLCVGYRVKVWFDLPLDEPASIKTEAVLVNEKGDESRNFKIEGFKFSDSLDEESRDLIHQFIIRKQFEVAKKNCQKPLE